MAPAPLLMTVAEYFRTPETLQPAELAYGVLRVAEAPTVRHQSAVGRLFVSLDQHVRRHRLGQVILSPVDVVLDAARHLVVQPDLVFVSTQREWTVRERIYGAPDLAIEVLSPRPRVGSVEEKLAWFAQYGVRECWLLHQDHRQLRVLQFHDRRVAGETVHGFSDAVESQVLRGFRATVAAILED